MLLLIPAFITYIGLFSLNVAIAEYKFSSILETELPKRFKIASIIASITIPLGLISFPIALLFI